MEGGLITLVVGTILVVLFTGGASEERKNRAAAHAIAAASGIGLLVSAYMRASTVLMALGLAMVACGFIYLLLPRRAAKPQR